MVRVALALALVAVCAPPTLAALDAAELVGRWEGKMIFALGDHTESASTAMTFTRDGQVTIEGADGKQQARFEVSEDAIFIRDPSGVADLVLKPVQMTRKALAARVSPVDRSKLPEGAKLRIELTRVGPPPARSAP